MSLALASRFASFLVFFAWRFSADAASSVMSLGAC